MVVFGSKSSVLRNLGWNTDHAFSDRPEQALEVCIKLDIPCRCWSMLVGNWYIRINMLDLSKNSKAILRHELQPHGIVFMITSPNTLIN